jgi:hypothetical protein
MIRACIAALVVASAAVPALAADPWAVTQESLYASLKRQKALSPDRKLVGLYYVCSLEVGRESWAVINVVENVPGAEVPRGFSQIMVLDAHRVVLKKLPYATEYPMFCEGNTLFVHGDLTVEGTFPAGNALTFTSRNNVSVAHIEANDLPVPRTANRQIYKLK